MRNSFFCSSLLQERVAVFRLSRDRRRSFVFPTTNISSSSRAGEKKVSPSSLSLSTSTTTTRAAAAAGDSITTRGEKEVAMTRDDAVFKSSSSSSSVVVVFRENLLKWYEEKKRKLPWRRFETWEEKDVFGDEEEEDASTAHERWERLSKNPSTRERVMSDDQYAYGVWVSEIMSQQTQIERVAEYWSRWVAKWPTVRHLANASEDEVRDMWAGLGYYRRSQFLLKGAKYVSEELDGRFPRDVLGLLKIPGIGPYTASAVGSIAFGLREAAIDGNVNRVLTRVRRIRGDPVKEKKTVDAIKRISAELIGKEEENDGKSDNTDEAKKYANRPGDFNQAMMELGATVCKPKNPSCSECPISAFCEGYQHELLSDGQDPVTAYPEIAKKAEKRQEAIAVAVVSCTFENTKWFYLTKRPENGLLAGMWEFPSVFMREGELAMNSVPSDADVYDAQKFFRESDSRGVSDLFASVASRRNDEKEMEKSAIKLENNKDDNRSDVEFKHEPGVVTHVFSHVKHYMHVFTLDLGTVDALPGRVKQEEEGKDEEKPAVDGANGSIDVETNAESSRRTNGASSSSWFQSSDFEDKGVFSTGVQKVFAFAEKREKHETSGNIRKRNDVNNNITNDENKDLNYYKHNDDEKKAEKRKKKIKTKDIASFFSTKKKDLE
jgi:A/G-specific adenine glycosylase